MLQLALLVIAVYKRLKSSDRLEWSENSMFRRPLGLLELNLTYLGASGDKAPVRQQP